MKIVQRNMESERVETIEEDEELNETDKRRIIKRQKKNNKSAGVGSFFGYWKKTKTGRMKMVFTKLETIPFIVARNGKRFYVFEDTKKRAKKHKALRVTKFS